MSEVEIYHAPAPSRTTETLHIAEDAWRLAQRITKTEFVPKGLQNRPEAVLAAILKGHELDLPPMTALGSIHVVNGRPGLSAELQRGLVTRAGHEIGFEEMSSTRVTCYGRRSDTGQELRVTWTMEDAKRAKLSEKDVWRQYPRNMLAARASADVCRFLFSDVTGGLRTVEELEDIPPETEAPALTAQVLEGDVVVDEPPPAANVRKAAAPTAAPRAAKKAAPRKAAAPRSTPAPQPPLPGEDESAFHADPEPPKKLSPAGVLAILAREVLGDIDRDDRLAFYAESCGRIVESGNDLTLDDIDKIRVDLDRIKAGDLEWPGAGAGRLRVVPDPDEGDVVEAEIVDEGDEWAPLETWSGDTWRDYCKHRGVLPAALVRAAWAIADENSVKPPGGIDDLPSCPPSLQEAILYWLDGAGS